MYVCMYVGMYINNWASGASPTLGCSIEISRDIYIYMLSVCRMSVVCQINCVDGITYGPCACSKSFFGGSTSDTRVIHFLYA